MNQIEKGAMTMGLRSLRFLPVFAALVFYCPLLQAGTAPAPLPPVVPQLVAESTSIQPDRETGLGVHFTIPSGWHLYWQNPGDSGRAPKVEWLLPSGFSIGELKWPAPERLMAGPLVNYGYSDSLLLFSDLRPPRKLPFDSPLVFRARLSWLVCKDVCVPGQAELKLQLPVSSSAPAESREAKLFRDTRSRLTRAVPSGWRLNAFFDNGAFTLNAEGLEGSASTGAFFFPRVKHVFDNVSEQVSAEGSRLRIVLRKSELAEEAPREFDGVLVAGGKAYDVRVPIARKAGLAALFEALLLAFLGGLILNLMPCVFPVLSIKAFSLIEQAHQERKQVRLHGIVYSIGILVSFWVLAGALIALRAGGQKLGWGFQLQSPIFDSFLVLLLFGLSLSLLGVFDFGGSLSGVGSGLASRQGITGAFFTGVLATVVATPCTAPFMGTALGFAASQPAPIAFLVFTFLAVGLALPYLALSLSPALGRFIPRPGRWMESVKQFMAFPLFGTVIWLLWVIGLQTGLTGMTRVLSGILLLGIAGWVYGRWRTRLAQIAIAGLVLCTLWVAVLGMRNSATAGEALRWEPYSRARLASLRAAGTPVFIDFTAAWCVTCKVNETLALSSPSIASRIRELGIVAMKGDWTNSDAEITQALAELGRNGVPLYVLYTRKKDQPPRILPQLLTADLVLEELNKVN